MKVFFCYSSSLKPVALYVAQGLNVAGLEVWLDLVELDGERLDDKILSYMREADLILFLADAEYFTGKTLPFDWRAASTVTTPKLVLAFGTFALPEHDQTFSVERPGDCSEATKVAESYIRAQQRLSCFISYAHKDLASADELLGWLARSRANVWIDRSGIPPGAQFPNEIERAIERSEWFFLLWSCYSEASPWVRREWSHAVQCGKRIVPILLDETPLPLELAAHYGFHSASDPRLRDYFQG